RRHTRWPRDWSSDVCSSDLAIAAKEPLLLTDFDPARESSAPYFIDYLNRVSEARASERGPRASISRGVQSRAPLNTEASAVVTTLDLDLQQLAQDAIQKQLARLDETYKTSGVKPQVAFVALDPHTGEVLAMI